MARLLQCLYQPSPLYSHDLVSGYAILTLHDLREENRLLIDRYIRRILFVGNDMAIKRIWHGWTTLENADKYRYIILNDVIPGIEEKKYSWIPEH